MVVQIFDPHQRNKTRDLFYLIPKSHSSDTLVKVQRETNISDEELLLFLAAFPKEYRGVRENLRQALALPEITPEIEVAGRIQGGNHFLQRVDVFPIPMHK